MPTILSIEDEENDFVLLRAALKSANLPVRLDHARDGLEAMRYLGEGNPLPELILLDLKLPIFSGFNVLALLRQTRRLAQIPVLVLSASESAADKEKAVALGAKGYIVKTQDFADAVASITAALAQSAGPGSSGSRS